MIEFEIISLDDNFREREVSKSITKKISTKNLKVSFNEDNKCMFLKFSVSVNDVENIIDRFRAIEKSYDGVRMKCRIKGKEIDLSCLK